MPMPAANIIAIQESEENSGSSSSRPSRMRPKRLKAMTRQATTKTLPAMMNSQEKLPSTQLRRGR